MKFFDGHNDVLLKLHQATRTQQKSLARVIESFGRGRDSGHLDLPRARLGRLAGGLFAVFVPPPRGGPPAFGKNRTADGYRVPLPEAIEPSWAHQETASMFDLFDQLMAAFPDDLQHVTGRATLGEALSSNRIAAVLHIEGAEAITDPQSDTKALYERGLRSLGPVWSRPNIFGTGVPFAYPATSDIGPGLTELGRRLLATCERLGIMVDLAHLNARGFWDYAEFAARPLVVSHTAAQALCPTARNLTDDQIDAVGASGGLVGVNLHVGDLRSDGRFDSDTPLDRWTQHVSYIAGRIGAEHVAIGSDMDGALMPRDFGDATGFPRLAEALARSGFNASEVEGIACSNWLRTLNTALASTRN